MADAWVSNARTVWGVGESGRGRDEIQPNPEPNTRVCRVGDDIDIVWMGGGTCGKTRN